MKVTFLENEHHELGGQIKNASVELLKGRCLPGDMERSFRVSPIFPLDSDSVLIDENFHVSFYHFEKPYQILSRIKEANKDLAKLTWYSVGINAVLVFAESRAHLERVSRGFLEEPISHEYWKVTNSCLDEVSFKISQRQDVNLNEFKIYEYTDLELSQRSVIDEFVACVDLLVSQFAKHQPYELGTLKCLIAEMNELILELNYVNYLNRKASLFFTDGKASDVSIIKPDSLEEFSEDELLRDVLVREGLKHQCLDRVIQVNAALSYVSTQTFSGVTPILERRSILRRHSLLGVGSAVKGVTKTIRFIEDAFNGLNIDEIINNSFKNSPKLSGIEEPLVQINTKKWSEQYGVDKWFGQGANENQFPKLAYFSGRLGFREAEYSISAANQALTCGGGLDWSILTITHEMTHGHVRDILKYVLSGDLRHNVDDEFKQMHACFRKFCQNPKSDGFTQLESIRNLFFLYLSLSLTHGSLTFRGMGRVENRQVVELVDLSTEDLRGQLQNENRNINEIMVHVLDLKYFYANRLKPYIALIWNSWSQVSHVKADLRQYVLRSLLSIASKEKGDDHKRFEASVNKFIDIVLEYQLKIGVNLVSEILFELGQPNIISETEEGVLVRLEDKSGLKKQHKEQLYDTEKRLFLAFKPSLIIVDLAGEIFFSKKVLSKLYDDENIHFENTAEGDFEDHFNYDNAESWSEVDIKSRTGYLLHCKELILEHGMNDDLLEEITAMRYIACI
ncbi:hypothetical protein [Owenweeksia hongkongensis]|uniref:hypothetical protein n=1 Tax=Owenweeksia hongkongensis TaxID=253245 RepID=UPI00145D95A4|nr:hypothetical protein [Owenweeksia hongkongensis]